MKKLDIVYEDKYLLIINKDANLLTVSNKKTKYDTLYFKASSYVKKQNKNNKVFIVNRLDKGSSGLVVFAKSMNVKNKMQNMWSEVKREYLAILEGYLKKDSDTLKFYLKEDKDLNVYVDKKNKNKKNLAITKYQVLSKENKNTLVLVRILSGKKHQIRVSFSHIGNPIVGDKRYNAKTNPYRRILLHAFRLEFKHPVSNKVIKLETKLPNLKVFKEMYNKYLEGGEN